LKCSAKENFHAHIMLFLNEIHFATVEDKFNSIPGSCTKNKYIKNTDNQNQEQQIFVNKNKFTFHNNNVLEFNNERFFFIK
jgi:hypothetical protein